MEIESFLQAYQPELSKNARFARSPPTVDKWIVLRLHIFVDSGLINDAAIIEQFIVTTY